MGTKFVFFHLLDLISALRGFRTAPRKGRATQESATCEQRHPRHHPGASPFPGMNAVETSPGFWPPRIWGCPSSSCHAFPPRVPPRHPLTTQLVEMDQLALLLCQSCHPPCSSVRPVAAESGRGSSGGEGGGGRRSKLLSVTNVALQGPRMGDPGHLLTWLDFMCALGLVTHTSPHAWTSTHSGHCQEGVLGP